MTEKTTADDSNHLSLSLCGWKDCPHTPVRIGMFHHSIKVTTQDTFAVICSDPNDFSICPPTDAGVKKRLRTSSHHRGSGSVYLPSLKP